MANLSPEEAYLGFILIEVAAFLSLISSIIFFRILWPKRKDSPTYADVIPVQLLLYITGTDIIGDLIYILGGFLPTNLKTPPSALCVFDAVANTIEGNSKLFWVTAVALNYYYSFKYLKFDAVIRYKKWLLLVCVGFPVLIGISLLIFHLVEGDVIGDVTLWCWLTSKYKEERFAYFYGWLFLCIVICAICYIGSFMFINEEVTPYIIFNFTCYMSTFFIAWTAACANRIYEWSNPNSINSVLTLFQAFCEPLQGFLLAMMYGVCAVRNTSKTKKEIPLSARPDTPLIEKKQFKIVYETLN